MMQKIVVDSELERAFAMEAWAKEHAIPALKAWLEFRGTLDGDYAWFRSEQAAALTKVALETVGSVEQGKGLENERS